MTLLKPSEPSFMTAEVAAQRRGYAAKSELALRLALEAFCRDRWPSARICHELVMGAKTVRADVVAIGCDHIAAFEVKGSYDDTVRLLHQVGMFQLCVPEVWMVVAANHGDDAKLIRHLIPSVGILVGQNMDRREWKKSEDPVVLTVEAEAAPRPAVPKLMLEMLWQAELYSAGNRLGMQFKTSATRPFMIATMLQVCREADLIRETCRELRGRNALWRADPAISGQMVPAPEQMGMGDV